MLTVIFRQIINRMRSNAWLLLELALVFCVVWYMVDYFFVLNYNLRLPSYIDDSHIWKVEVAQLPETHPEYQPGESDSTALEANFERVMNRLQAFPGVEEVAVSFMGGLIGGGTFAGMGLPYPSDTTRKWYGQAIYIDPRYDYFRVFRLSTDEGKCPASVHDYNWDDPHTLVICATTARQLFPGQEAIGKELTSLPGDDVGTYVVRGVVDQTKRFAYERPRPIAIKKLRADYTNIEHAEISVRSQATLSDAHCLERVNQQLAGELRIGNFYLHAVSSLENIADHTAYFFGFTNTYHVYVGLFLFFLVNISLCVIGSFWYRVRMRRDEIGLRMAMGATRQSIRRMFFLEGLILLTLAVIPALIIELQFVFGGLLDTLGVTYGDDKKYLPDHVWLRFTLTNLLTWLFLSAVIVGAVWLPACHAATLAPADALHEE